MTTKQMTIKQAENVAKLAWSRLMEQAQIELHGMPYALKKALKSEISKSDGWFPLHLAKVRLVESALSGAERPLCDLGDLWGIREGHQTALMIGARLGAAKMASVDTSDLATAGEVLSKAWQGRGV